MRYYSTVAVQTALTSAISNSATTINVGSTTGFPVSFPYSLHLDLGTPSEELVEVTNASGTTLTVTRGVDGTSPVAHSVGGTVIHGVSARDFAEPQAHIAAATNVHGLILGSAVVGTTDTQTLTNKTLTSPTINGGTLSGTTLTSPTITDFTNAQHDHHNAATGGSALVNSILTTPTINGGALSGTFTGSPTLSGSPVFSGQPSVADLTNIQHDHGSAAKGGTALNSPTIATPTITNPTVNSGITVNGGGTFNGNPNFPGGLTSNSRNVTSDGAWTNLTLINSYTAGSGYTPAYQFLNPNQIRFRGVLNKTGTMTSGDVFCTLPAGRRPASTQRFIIATSTHNAGMGVRLDIDSSGNMTIVWSTTGLVPTVIGIDNVVIDLT